MCGIVACKHNKEQIQSEIIKKALKKFLIEVLIPTEYIYLQMEKLR